MDNPDTEIEEKDVEDIDPHANNVEDGDSPEPLKPLILEESMIQVPPLPLPSPSPHPLELVVAANDDMEVVDMFQDDSEPRQPQIPGQGMISPPPEQQTRHQQPIPQNRNHLPTASDINTPPRFLFRITNHCIISPCVDLNHSGINRDDSHKK